MKDFPLWLKNLREKRGMKQNAAAKAAAMSPATLGRLERGIGVTVERSSVASLAPVLQVPVDDLLSNFDAWRASISEKSNAEILTEPGPAVPTYEAKVAACNWIPIEEVYWLDTKKYGAIVDSGLFRVRVLGDCMEPRWHDGDLVEFRIVRLDREAYPVGEDAILIHYEDKVTFKRIWSVNDDTITLYALNSAKYPEPILVPKQMITRIAVAKKLIVEPRKVAFRPAN